MCPRWDRREAIIPARNVWAGLLLSPTQHYSKHLAANFSSTLVMKNIQGATLASARPCSIAQIAACVRFRALVLRKMAFK
jgi:hypothetical protein